VTLAVGMSVERDRLRAVGVRREHVLWGVDAELSDDTTLDASLNAFFVRLPVGRFARPKLTVALGSTYAQTKRLTGLPPLRDERALARTVSEHAARFFLRNGVPLVTTSVRLDAAGQPWGAALQRDVVETIVGACRANRLRLSGIVTAADVARPDVGALASLGHGASGFAAAYGAAVTPGALTWRANQLAETHTPRWRMAAGGCALAISILLAALTPELSAHLAERRAIGHLSGVAGRNRVALRVARDNGLVTRALSEVGTFDRGRRPVTVLMAAIAHELPEGAALLALHIDSIGGSIVVLAPRAGALLGQLEHVSGLAAPEITGPVTRETAGGHEVEHATIRFKWTTQPR
jgi:hypothetical protein